MTDFCLSRPMLDHVLRQAATMDRMMAAVGVEPAVAVRVEQGTAFFEARTRCIECRALAACKAWLGNSGEGATPPPFCPNGSFFGTCLEKAAKKVRPLEQRPL